jgi:hypothetical protein
MTLKSHRWLVVLLSSMVWSCGDLTVPSPAPGTVQVVASTTGLDGPGAYSIFVDETSPKTLSAQGTIDVSQLAPGEHEVRIAVAPNCAVEGDVTRTVVVASNATTLVSFSVSCVATFGILSFSVSTSGPDKPYNYSLRAGPTTNVNVLATMVGSIGELAPGPHVVMLENVPAHCSVPNNPRTVDISIGTTVRDTAFAEFLVTCTALTGVVEVSVATGGDDSDMSGYRLSLDNGQSLKTVYSNSTTLFGSVSGGQHTIALSEVATNCTVTGLLTRSVPVTIGGATQDTTRVAFEIVCARVEKIAFTRYDNMYTPRIVVAHVDGQDEYGINLEGYLGSWSQDGKNIVMLSIDCDDWYGYYYGCNHLGIQTVALDKLPLISPTLVTRTWQDDSPAFSPDGKRIAFTRSNILFVMKADGTDPVVIVNPGEATNVRAAFTPTWSPDGQRIAFSCELWQVAWADICVADANGGNLTRLTTDAYSDFDPAWSPDGTRIAFRTNRGTIDGTMHVATMSATGTDFVQLRPGLAPAWSPDGRILFAAESPDRGIFIMNADGTQVRRLTGGNDHGPKWRP